MRAYASHEHARRRMEGRLQQRSCLSLDDLLRYLEDVSSEPTGEHAYGLALSLLSMNLSAENLYALLCETRDRLESSRIEGSAHVSVRANLESAARLLQGQLEKQSRHPSNPATPTKKNRESQQASRQPDSEAKEPDDTELRAARDHGYQIGAELRGHYKWRLFHNMAALAICWTCLKPSSGSASEALPWIEEDVRRMFP